MTIEIPPTITRVDIATLTGNIEQWANEWEFLVQDDGRTLKIRGKGNGNEARAQRNAERRRDLFQARACAHCGRRGQTYGQLNDWPLCHPDEGMDCYHLVTAYGEPVGARLPGGTLYGQPDPTLRPRSE